MEQPNNRGIGDWESVWTKTCCRLPHRDFETTDMILVSICYLQMHQWYSTTDTPLRPDNLGSLPLNRICRYLPTDSNDTGYIMMYIHLLGGESCLHTLHKKTNLSRIFSADGPMPAGIQYTVNIRHRCIFGTRKTSAYNGIQRYNHLHFYTTVSKLRVGTSRTTFTGSLVQWWYRCPDPPPVRCFLKNTHCL